MGDAVEHDRVAHGSRGKGGTQQIGSGKLQGRVGRQPFHVSRDRAALRGIGQPPDGNSNSLLTVTWIAPCSREILTCPDAISADKELFSC